MIDVDQSVVDGVRRRRRHDIEVVQERHHQRAVGRLDDDQRHLREHVLPVGSQGFSGLGIDGDVRNGFSAIRVSFDIDADASEEDIAAIVAQSQKRSAVFDLLTNPTPVSVSV